jgi:ActR/RegA family two-component response regulator
VNAIYIVRKPEDMTGICPTCYANVEKLAEAVNAGAWNYCKDPAHVPYEPPTVGGLVREDDERPEMPS